MAEILTIAADHYVISLTGICMLLWLTARLTLSVSTAMMRERTRREIAAYIAEGTMKARSGERLMRAAIGCGRLVP